MMNRPLWRIMVHIGLLAFCIHRGAAAMVLHLSGASPVLVVATALQVVAGLYASMAIFFGRAMVTSAMVLGATIALTAVLQLAIVGSAAAPAAISQVFVAIVATAGFVFLIRRAAEDDRDPSRRGS
jgi:hypothetical protein